MYPVEMCLPAKSATSSRATWPPAPASARATLARFAPPSVEGTSIHGWRTPRQQARPQLKFLHQSPPARREDTTSRPCAQGNQCTREPMVPAQQQSPNRATVSTNNWPAANESVSYPKFGQTKSLSSRSEHLDSIENVI